MILILIPCFSQAQQSLHISMTFGSYTDDSVNKKFHARERIWELKNKKLIYVIDANEKRYSDTIILTKEEFDMILKYVQENDLLKSVEEKFYSEFMSKHEYNETLKGEIVFNKIAYPFMFSANGIHLIEQNSFAKQLMELEQIFYKIVESNS